MGTDLHSSWRTLGSTARHPWHFLASHGSLYEHDLAEQMRSTKQLVGGLSSAALTETSHALRVQTRTSMINTGVATGLDIANHFPVFDPLKALGTRGPA